MDPSTEGVQLGAVVAFLMFTALLFFAYVPRGRRLPPGPPALPIIGHLHLLGQLPHRSLHKLSRKYGPLMHIRLGSQPTLVVSSPPWAKEFLQNYDVVFASRPSSEANKRLFHNSGAVLLDYGPQWKDRRRLYSAELLGAKRFEMFKHIRAEEVSAAVDEIVLRSQEGKFVMAVNEFLVHLSGNIVCRMLFSQRAFKSSDAATDFKGMMVELVVLLGSFEPGDLFPFVKWLDLFGYKARMDHLSKRFDAFVDRILSDRRDEIQKGRRVTVPPDFLDAMMYKFEDTKSIKGVMLEILAGGTETSSATVEWTMTELLRNPRVLKKLRDELDSIVGLDRRVDESDLPKLSYLQAVVKETFRCHPVGPLLVPRVSSEGCEVAGYYFPAKTRLLFNVWGMGRDPCIWDKPEEFRPERFMDSTVDVRGQHYELIPFGAGRRQCPGLGLALTMVQLTVSALVQGFEWSLASGESPESLDMLEAPGITAARAQPLLLVPKPRSNVSWLAASSTLIKK